MIYWKYNEKSKKTIEENNSVVLNVLLIKTLVLSHWEILWQFIYLFDDILTINHYISAIKNMTD